MTDLLLTCAARPRPAAALLPCPAERRSYGSVHDLRITEPASGLLFLSDVLTAPTTVNTWALPPRDRPV